MPIRIAILAPMLSALAGCGVRLADEAATGGTDGKGDGSGSGTLSARTFLDRIGKGECDARFRCRSDYPSGPDAFDDEWGSSPAECYEDADRYYMPEEVEEEIREGSILYSATAAAACLAGIVYPSSCAVLWSDGGVFPATCSEALIGTVPDGDRCDVDFECADPASYCEDRECVGDQARPLPADRRGLRGLRAGSRG